MVQSLDMLIPSLSIRGTFTESTLCLRLLQATLHILLQRLFSLLLFNNFQKDLDFFNVSLGWYSSVTLLKRTHTQAGSLLLQFLKIFSSHFPLDVQFILGDCAGHLDALPPISLLKMCVPVQTQCVGLSDELLKSRNGPPRSQSHLDDRAQYNMFMLVHPALLLNRQHEILEFFIPPAWHLVG